jgi:long-chain fatty acid transport protein
VDKKGIAILAILFSSLFWLFAPVALRAGGWNNTLLGCRAIAIGGAFAGIADDPSAIFYNPGGLVFQANRLNLSVDGFYIWPTYEYTPPTGQTVRSRYESPLPQLFLTYRTSERLTLGLGFYVPYAGSGVDWKREDLGFSFKSSLGVFSITPTIAYQINERLSVGLNLNFYTASFDLKADGLPIQQDGSAGLELTKTEEKGSALSASLGLLYRASERISLGLTIRGPARIKMEGETSMTFEPYNIKLDSESVIRLPWDFEAGLSFRATERLLLAADAQYTLWSVLDKVEKTIRGVPYTGNVSFDEAMNFKDILILRAGAEYLFHQGLFLRAGIGFDRSATPLETLSFANIDVDKVTLLGGVGLRSGRMQIDFATAYGWGKEREKDSPFSAMYPGAKEKFNLDVFIVGVGVTFSY